MYRFLEQMRRLYLSKEEMVLTTMLVIFEDRANKGDSCSVSRLQEKFGLMLQHLMNLESRRQVRNGKNKFAVSFIGALLNEIWVQS